MTNENNTIQDRARIIEMIFRDVLDWDEVSSFTTSFSGDYNGLITWPYDTKYAVLITHINDEGEYYDKEYEIHMRGKDVAFWDVKNECFSPGKEKECLTKVV